MFNPDWQKTVVFIGQKTNEKKFIGTGVLLSVSDIHHLVTAKHVIFDKNGEERKNLFISLNSKTGEVLDRKIDDLKSKFNIDWIIHEDSEVDIALIPMGLDLKNDDVKVIPEISFSNVSENNLAEDVFFLGFQPGLSLTRVKPIIRAGIISRIEDDETFFIDTTAFPGNSGSPVFLKPSFINPSAKGTQLGFQHAGKFIGILGAYVPYQEFARSEQTGNIRVMFEENTGISKVCSIKYIKEIFSSQKFKEQLSILKGEKSQDKIEVPKIS